MEKHYLVDFENVGSDGMAGCEALSASDHIHLFFTDNSRKINLDIVANHGGASFDTYKVDKGKQSLDMHLASYLGFLMGRDPEKESSFVVISKDCDYDGIISYWKDSERNILRFPTIKDSMEEKTEKTVAKADAKAEAKAEAKPQVKASRKKTAKKQTGKPAEKPAVKQAAEADNTPNKATLNNEIQQALSKAGYPNDVISSVASLAVKHFSEKNAKQITYIAIIKKFGQSKGLDIYNQIKKKL